MKQLLFPIFILVFFAFGVTACNGDKKTKENSALATEKKDLLAKDEMYTCTMHNEVMSDHKGECPKCGMKLVKQKMTVEQEKMMKKGTYMKPKE